MHKYFNPNTFSNYLNFCMPIFILATTGFLLSGTYLGLFHSPPDYQQGDSVRIMYVHVPAAMLALGIYLLMATASAASLIWRNPLSDIIARAAAPIGAGFTAICLITGSIWGKPMWGTWWVWDARLTSMLILLFLYIGYISLANAFSSKERSSKPCALLCLFGTINIPIIKFSVEWWNTLHQPASLLRTEGIAIHNSMLLPLSLCFIGFTCLFLIIWSLNIKKELLQAKILRLSVRKSFTTQ